MLSIFTKRIILGAKLQLLSIFIKKIDYCKSLSSFNYLALT
ncbi:hypothetical protein JCM19302_2542 [Jejuia pallidilutea]|uniref:Uncharacterized protein n=1 Tax=Jejuia pallidilutea TaxID=504487 RepID=A0A090W8J3_9FLAO|nr:hypothetical protein JCM19302_2542 [Jejuia pallidilutea]